MNKQLREHKVVKEYVALVAPCASGSQCRPPQLPRKLRHYMDCNSREPKQVSRCEKAGWRLCESEVLHVRGVSSTPVDGLRHCLRLYEVRLRLLTGRTHQIRAQVSSAAHHPLPYYGTPMTLPHPRFTPTTPRRHRYQTHTTPILHPYYTHTTPRIHPFYIPIQPILHAMPFAHSITLILSQDPHPNRRSPPFHTHTRADSLHARASQSSAISFTAEVRQRHCLSSSSSRHESQLSGCHLCHRRTSFMITTSPMRTATSQPCLLGMAFTRWTTRSQNRMHHPFTCRSRLRALPLITSVDGYPKLLILQRCRYSRSPGFGCIFCACATARVGCTELSCAHRSASS